MVINDMCVTMGYDKRVICVLCCLMLSVLWQMISML